MYRQACTSDPTATEAEPAAPQEKPLFPSETSGAEFQGLGRSQAAESGVDKSSAEGVAQPKSAVDPFVFGGSIVNPDSVVKDTDDHKVIALLGPTNSGKTYRALQLLKEHGSGCYAGPLRMLAREVYDKGRGMGLNFGYRTSEEQLNPDAPFQASTVECARKGGLLVLDEVQWCSIKGEGRSYAWTRLMATADARYDKVVLCGPSEIEPLLRRAFPSVHVERLLRRSSLVYHGKVKDTLPWPGTVAVVAFSRKVVLGLAAQYQASDVSKRGVGVLYGAMPLEVRLEQIRRVHNGETHVIVCTDVIGHGINLPIDHVVFAETQKFDGRTVRSLLPWEIRQIAGRAGRGSSTGHVYASRKCSDADQMLLRTAFETKNDLKAEYAYDEARCSELVDIGCKSLFDMDLAFEIWNKRSRTSQPWIQRNDSRISSAHIRELATKCRALVQGNRLSLREVPTPERAWRMLTLPVCEENEPRIWNALLQKGVCCLEIPPLPSTGSTATLETHVKLLNDLATASFVFPDAKFDRAAYEAGVKAATERLKSGLDESIQNGMACESCGSKRETIRHSLCDSCYRGNRGGGYCGGGYGDYYHDSDGDFY